MRRVKFKYAVMTVPVLIASVLAVLALPLNVSAATIDEQKDKYAARAIYNCYMKGKVKDNVKSSDVHKLSDVVDDSTKMAGLPPGMYSSDEYTCAGLMGALPNPINDDLFANTDQAVALLDKLGYSKKKGAGARKCETFSFESSNQEGVRQKDVAAPILCADVSDSGVVSNLGAKESRATTGDYVFALTPYIDSTKVSLVINANEIEYNGDYLEVGVKSGVTKWTDLISSLNSMLSNYSWGKRKIMPTGSSWDAFYYQGHSAAPADTNDSESVYTLNLSATDESSYKKAYKNLTGKSFPNLNISPEERLALYQDYLVSYYGLTTNSCADKESDVPKDAVAVGQADDPTGWHLAKIFKEDGKAQYCYVKATSHAGDKIYGVEAGSTKNLASMPNDPGRIGFMEIIEALNSSNLDKISADLASGIGKASEEDSKKEEDEGDPTLSCFDGGGALGWVLCPVMEAASNAVNQIYEGFIEPALTINADLLAVNDGSDKDAYDVWQIFQTFANIAFAIMILVVIISQLTGVGIDNYGIKRILPRLIISALLINLSFIICQLAVDISNILGVSLKGLFDGLGPSAVVSGSTASGNTAAWVTIIVSVVAVGGAFLSLGLGVIIPILVAIISALIAVFFLFIVLAGRQAAVVILVVISPLALVMYMLPNTKKYFDKFIKIFATLLVVFPICGLVMGGGNFASRVLLAAGGASADSFNADGSGFFYQISAVLVGIVPFFFIPSLVKNSLAGLGNIGAKVSGIGSKVSGRATKTARGGLEHSRLGAAAKDRQAYRDQVLQRRRAGINRKGEVTKLGQFRRNVADGKRLKLFTTQAGRDRMKMAMGNAQSEILKSDAALTGAERMLDGSHVEAVRAGMGAADFEQAVKDQAALIDEMTDGNGNRIVDSPEALGNVYSSALSDLSANPDSSEAKAKVYALQNRLASTDAGRAQLQSRLEAAVDSGQTAGLNAAASHLVNDHAGDIKNVNRGLFKWASQAAGGNISSMASHYADGTDKYTAQTIAAADEAALQHLASSFGGMNSDQQSDIANTAYEALNSDNINLKPEVRKQLEEIVDSAKKAGVTPRITAGQTEAQAQTQALNDINDTLREIHANQSAPTPPPQPKDNGPSTEDWDDYIHGNGDFA